MAAKIGDQVGSETPYRRPGDRHETAAECRKIGVATVAENETGSGVSPDYKMPSQKSLRRGADGKSHFSRDLPSTSRLPEIAPKPSQPVSKTVFSATARRENGE